MKSSVVRGDSQRRRSGAVMRGVTLCPRSGAATRGVTPRLRSGVVAGRRYPHAPKPEARHGGREQLPRTPMPEAGAVAGRTNPTSKELWLHKRRRA